MALWNFAIETCMCLSREHIVSLGVNDKETIIFEAELLALVVAMSQWAPLFQGCPVVCSWAIILLEMLPFLVAPETKLPT